MDSKGEKPPVSSVQAEELTPFQLLAERFTNDTDKLRLYQLREALNLEPSHQLWTTALLLEHRLASYGSIPIHVDELIEKLHNTYLDHSKQVSDMQDHYVKHLSNEVSQSVARAHLESNLRIDELLQFLHSGAMRQTLLTDLTQETIKTTNTFATTITQTSEKALGQFIAQQQRFRESIFPEITKKWLIFTVALAVGLVSLSILILHVYDLGAAHDSGFTAGGRERMLREAAFYDSLPSKLKSSMRTYNRQQQENMQMYFILPR